MNQKVNPDTIIKCANCNKKLMHILKFKENETKNKIQATCPFCNGHSEKHTFTGVIYSGPITEEDGTVNLTFIKDIEMLPDHSRFIIGIK